ncbi:MAG: hypothetical protein AAGC69_18205 [Paracraurococcus sp.]|jgi:hypothetical protein
MGLHRRDVRRLGTAAALLPGQGGEAMWLWVAHDLTPVHLG